MDHAAGKLAYRQQKTGLYARVAGALIIFRLREHAQNDLLEFEREFPTGSADLPEFQGVPPADIEMP